MNYKILNRFLIGFALSCIVAGFVGNKFSIEKYYSVINSKKEISLQLYKQYGELLTIKESKFNSDLAVTYGLISFGTCFILLSLISYISPRKKEVEKPSLKRISLNSKLRLAKLPKEEQEKIIKEFNIKI